MKIILVNQPSTQVPGTLQVKGNQCQVYFHTRTKVILIQYLFVLKKSVLGLWIFLELWRQGTVRFVSRMQIKCINSVFWAIVTVVEKRKCVIPFLNLATRLGLWMCLRIICWAPLKFVRLKDLRQKFGLTIEFLPFTDQYTAFCHSKKIWDERGDGIDVCF